VVGFLTAAHKGDWQTASQFIASIKGEDPAELATELSVVLDQGLPANLSQLSDQPEGKLKDNLPPNKELAGTIVTDGGPLNIVLERVRRGNQYIWLFSPETLVEIPAVYDEFSSTGITDLVPHPLMRRGSLGIPLWQWLVLLIGVALALVVAASMRKISGPILRRVFRSIAEPEDQPLLDHLIGPLRGLVALLLLAATISILHLPWFARELWYYVGGGLGIMFAGWLVARTISVSGRLFGRRLRQRGGADATAVIRLCERMLIAITFGVVIIQLLRLAHLVKDVSTLVAGLGVGGIAIAFAAQKTLENLFGGVSLIFDRTIRVGDTCRIGDQTGTVEDIGLRSTSLRTDARTILTVPNGQLSAMTVENLGMREKIYFRHVIGLRYETTAAQMRAVLEALRKLLAEDPRVEPDSSRVRLTGMAASSLNLEVAAYISTTNYLQFLEAQEDLLLRIMDTIESLGAATAFPSQTVYLSKDRKPSSPRT